MILGISASGRKNKIIHQTVKAIALKTGMEYEVISLAGKKINGCIGCVQCVHDNLCKVQDDWNDIGKKMTDADIIIFGAPNYYGSINALGHACLERTFSFRHLGNFTLKGKIGISVSNARENLSVDPVKETIQKFMISNQMEIIGHVTAQGYDQCYTCGVGHFCEVGNVVKCHGILEKIEKEHLPKEFSEQFNTIEQVDDVVRTLLDRLA